MGAVGKTADWKDFDALEVIDPGKKTPPGCRQISLHCEFCGTIRMPFAADEEK